MGALTKTAWAAGPPLLFGLRLWASVCLALYVAFWLELDNAYWAGTSAALVCQPHLGASLRKGWFRMIGTLVGAVWIVALSAWFPQDRVGFLVGLALWGGTCALVATLLRNFASYAAALAGYTAAIIASDTLGATGGTDGQAFTFAIIRVSEIWIGIVCAGVVLAGTDFGAAPRRLAGLLADLSAKIAVSFGATLTSVYPSWDTQPIRRELIRQVIALDPVIDEAIGESSQLRYHSPVLQKAVYGLFAALAGWRTVAARLARMQPAIARRETRRVAPVIGAPGSPSLWIADPIGMRTISVAAIHKLIAMRAGTPSLRLLGDEAARVLAGLSRVLDALALLTANHTRRRAARRRLGLYVPDSLPALVNAARALVAIGAVEVFWIASEWPSGALAITWTAIAVILFAPRADEAYTRAVSFMVGNSLAAVGAAIIAFAVLPKVETFAGFSIVIGAYLIPVGAPADQVQQTLRPVLWIPTDSRHLSCGRVAESSPFATLSCSMALTSTKERPIEILRDQSARRLHCADLAAAGGSLVRYNWPAPDRGPLRLGGPCLASGAARVRGVRYHPVVDGATHSALSSPCPKSNRNDSATSRPTDPSLLRQNRCIVPCARRGSALFRS